jgi:hypothetical protein
MQLAERISDLKAAVLAELRRISGNRLDLTPDLIIPVFVEERSRHVNLVPTEGIRRDGGLYFSGLIEGTEERLSDIPDAYLAIESLVEILELSAYVPSVRIAIAMKLIKEARDEDLFVRVRGEGQEYVFGPFNKAEQPKVALPPLADFEVSTKLASEPRWKIVWTASGGTLATPPRGL